MTVSPFWGVLMVGRIRQFAADGTLPKVVCRFCHSEISHGASKCVVCGSFQNWRRHLQFSSTVLSLLVALVSVTALATPLLINVLTVQDSEISARVIEAEVLLVNRSATLDMVGDSYVVDTLNVCMNVVIAFANIGEMAGMINAINLRIGESGFSVSNIWYETRRVLNIVLEAPDFGDILLENVQLQLMNPNYHGVLVSERLDLPQAVETQLRPMSVELEIVRHDLSNRTLPLEIDENRISRRPASEETTCS